VGVLKSNLQKAVRRQKPHAAVATLLQLLAQAPEGPLQLLRRLPIIMVEDTVLHPQHMCQLLWLACAHQEGWPLGPQDVRTLLRITTAMCGCRYRDGLSTAPSAPESTLQQQLGRLPRGLRDGLAALLLRSRAGGMASDKAFMRDLVARWCARSDSDGGAAEALLAEAHGASADVDDTAAVWTADAIRALAEAGLPADAMLPEAVDFHCHPGLYDSLRAAMGEPTLDNTAIKAAIWWCRSSLNERPFLAPTEAETAAAAAEEQRQRAANARDYESRISPYIGALIAPAWAPVTVVPAAAVR
jgi:hypothetical protein